MLLFSPSVRISIIGANIRAPEVKADFASGIENIVRDVLRKELPFFCRDDALTLEKTCHGFRITYSSTQASVSPSDATVLKLRLQRDVREMWIGDLRVGTRFRMAGFGRQLVTAAEGVARATGMAEVNVLPLSSSRDFWLKMGYAPHRHTARVLSKPVNRHSHLQEIEPEAADQVPAPQ